MTTTPPPSTTPAGTSLYIGNINADTAEQDVINLVSTYGQIVEAIFRREQRTNQGYCLVTMASPEDASRVIEHLQCAMIKGSAIRVMPRDSDSKARKLGIGNLYVAGLPAECTEKTLLVHFSAVGPVTSCMIPRGPTGAPLGYGYVAFSSQELANKAIDELDQKPVIPGTQPVTIKLFVKSAERKTATFKNLYIKGLRGDITQEELHEAFGLYGSVTSVALKVDSLGRPFGFVAFSEAESAQRAIEDLHGKISEHLSEVETPLYVQKALSRTEREAELRRKFAEEDAIINGSSGAPPMPMSPPPYQAAPPVQMMAPPPVPMMMPQYPTPYPQNRITSLFFRADASIPKELIKAAFQRYGRTPRFNAKPQNGNIRTGIVSMETPQEAAEALKHLNGETLKPKTFPLHVSYVNRKPNFGGGANMHPSPMWHGSTGYPAYGAHPNGRSYGAPQHGKGMPASAGGQNRGTAASNAMSVYFSSLSGQERADAVEKQLREKIRQMKGKDIAAKVTPSLVKNMDISELLNFFDSPDSLENAIKDALAH